MNRHYALPHLGSSIRQAHADRLARPGRQTDGTAGDGILRLVNGLEPALRRTVRRISRRRRAAIRKRQALSGHHRTDIGLDRAQIASTVDGIIETDGRSA